MARLRTIVGQWLDWAKIGPVIEGCRRLIDAEVKADGKKLYSYAEFAASLVEAPAGGGRRGQDRGPGWGPGGGFGPPGFETPPSLRTFIAERGMKDWCLEYSFEHPGFVIANPFDACRGEAISSVMRLLRRAARSF